jgi:molecular chaperone DnaJ
MPRDYYEVLGVPRDADEATVKKSFRRLARELHPDVNAHDPDAEEKFKEAAEAYEVLSDPTRRQTYDAYGHDGLKSGGFSPNFEGFGSISDLFSAFFGQGGGFDSAFGGTRMRGGAVQGGDVALAVAISLGDAARGTSVEVSYDATALCETCHGNGAEPGTPIVTCDKCRGAGQIQAVQRTRFGQMVRTALCDKCGGDGRIAEKPCHTCDGRGMTVAQRRVKVDIPAGIEDGQRMRVGGAGHAGEAGAPAGDLYVQVAVAPDGRFERQGTDLLSAVRIPATEAMLGTTVTVPTLDGEREIELEAGIQPGHEETLRGAGLPRLGGRKRGDQRIVVEVVVPTNLSEEQREIAERLDTTLEPDNLGPQHGDGLFGRFRKAFR